MIGHSLATHWQILKPIQRVEILHNLVRILLTSIINFSTHLISINLLRRNRASYPRELYEIIQNVSANYRDCTRLKKIYLRCFA